MEIKVDETLHRPRQHDDDGNDSRADPGESSVEDSQDRNEGQRDDQCLDDEEKSRIRPDQVKRLDEGDDGVEVVAEKVVLNSFDGRPRGMSQGVAAYRLVEDSEVVPGRTE